MNRFAGLRALLLVTVAAVLLLNTSEAAAQTTTCAEAPTDMFSIARKGRRLIVDYQRLRAIHVNDMARVAELYRSQTGREKPWSAAVAGVIETNTIYGFDACSNQGPAKANLNPWLLGGILSIDLNTVGIRSELFALTVIDWLAVAPTTVEGTQESVGMANLRGEQSMIGGRLQFRDWASVVVGTISSGAVQNHAGEDGQQLITGGESTPSDRLYLGMGVPRYNVYAHILFDPGDVAADTLDVRLDGIPLFYADLFGLLALRYIEDESQLTLELGVQNILGFLIVDVGFEHRPLNFRHVRARADWSAFSGWDADELVEIEPGLEAYPRFGFDYGAFAEASWFQSRYLREQTHHEDVWGMYAGLFVRPDITILMGRLDIFFGVNRPEHIERLSQSADHWEFGIRTHGRFGL